MNIRIDGISNDTIDKLSVSSFLAPIPERIDERVEILNKNGSIIINSKYDNRKVSIDCYFKNTTSLRSGMRDVINYFKVDYDVLINFSNDEKIFYYGRFNSLSSLKQNNIYGCSFSVEFICEPEYYKIINPLIDINDIETIEDIVELTIGVDYLHIVN